MIISVITEDATILVESEEIVAIIWDLEQGQICLKNSEKILGIPPLVKRVADLWINIKEPSLTNLMEENNILYGKS
jgi:hypothetical protein